MPKEQTMELGAFSISLAVKDVESSREFYEKLGFLDPDGNLILVDQHVWARCVRRESRRSLRTTCR
jgi:hypothetical protein